MGMAEACIFLSKAPLYSMELTCRFVCIGSQPVNEMKSWTLKGRGRESVTKWELIGQVSEVYLLFWGFHAKRNWLTWVSDILSKLQATGLG